VSAVDGLVIGLGGNIGNDAAIVERFRRAKAMFERLGATRSAALYRSEAIGVAQPAFLNSALHVADLGVPPAQLIATVLELERDLGRERSDETRGGPRTIDLDILLWGDHVVSLPDLVVPHPRVAGRRFALAPLVDLVGDDVVLPGTSKTLRELLDGLRDQRVELVTASW
jgi:2-amino-4-hydroxy-6-hydroxymethyldihydropteridine diphosphokinase